MCFKLKILIFLLLQKNNIHFILWNAMIGRDTNKKEGGQKVFNKQKRN